MILDGGFLELAEGVRLRRGGSDSGGAEPVVGRERFEERHRFDKVSDDFLLYASSVSEDSNMQYDRLQSDERGV